MTSTWRRVIPLAVEWSRERVGIWSKTAWSGQGCAGCHPVRKRCWTYEPPTSMASGMPSGTSTSRRRMNGFTAKYGRLGEVNPVVTPSGFLQVRQSGHDRPQIAKRAGQPIMVPVGPGDGLHGLRTQESALSVAPLAEDRKPDHGRQRLRREPGEIREPLGLED